MKISKNKVRNLTAAAVFLCSMAVWPFYGSKQPSFKWVAFHQGFVEHPSDILAFDNKLWITELLNHRVVAVDKLTTGELVDVKPDNKKHSFFSPHFLASDQENLYISEGWGSSIYALDKTNNYAVSKHPDNSKELNAPHGICMQNDWLYIADSLNSRLVRIKQDETQKLEIFSDKENKIAYGRQLICREDGIWLSNSYEKREGLNSGQGSNILLIKNFESGVSETVLSFEYSNITGINIIKNRYLITALWHANKVVVYDLKKRKFIEKAFERSPEPSGPAYGIYYAPKQKRLYIAYIGDIFNKTHKGGIAEYRLN